jgi:ABC-type dipeptide/oligopeptide/nickel transport system permease subunit
VKKMATRKTKLAFTIRRLRNFIGQIRQSKRGIIGVGVIVFFVIVGILAPVIAPYDPIAPMLDIGEYPAYGEYIGPKIADKLCYPAWYKYLPWVHRGPVENKETYFNVYLIEFGQTFQLFGRLGEEAYDNVLLLSKKAAEPKKVSATFPDGNGRDLIFMEEWNWESKNPDIIEILKLFPEGTHFEATYLSGEDIVENMQAVSDHTFSAEQTFYNEWNWTTSLPDLMKVQYNSQEGFEDDGCIEISYTPELGETPEGEVNATVFRPFEYQYWEPPKSFFTHVSVRLEASPETHVNITVKIHDDTKDETYLIAKLPPLPPKASYIHMKDVSTSNKTRQNVGSQYPEQVIFPTPANMSFDISVSFSDKDKNATVYIDNANYIIYGNAFGLLGTDNGQPSPPRDIFSTLVYGTRVSLIVGVLSALFSTVIGLFLGLVSGYIGGIVDEGIMRFADLLLVLPTLPLFIVLIAVMRATYGLVSMWNIIILITFFGWMSFSRSVRSMVISIRERPFIEAAKAAGAGKFYIITKHIVPNVFALVYVTLATSVPGAIITEASLSWLGLGDPMIPSWGKILYDFNTSGIAVTKGLTDYWFWIFPPCISIALLATAFILLGFALDEILNPRLRERR